MRMGITGTTRVEIPIAKYESAVGGVREFHWLRLYSHYNCLFNSLYNRYAEEATKATSSTSSANTSTLLALSVTPTQSHPLQPALHSVAQLWPLVLAHLLLADPYAGAKATKRTRNNRMRTTTVIAR